MNLDLLDRALCDAIEDTSKVACLRNLPVELAQIGGWNKLLAGCTRKYFLLYTGPILELVADSDTSLAAPESPYWSPLMTSHTILSLYLRVLDDVVDGDARGIRLMKAVRLAGTLLAEAIRRVHSCGLVWTHEAQELCNQWISYEESLSEGLPVVFDDLWQRASTLLVIPHLYTSTNRDDLLAYRQYLCLMILVHDIHDLFDDVRGRRRTIPVELFQSGDASVFTPTVAKAAFGNLTSLVSTKLAALRDFCKSRNLRYWPILLDVVSQDFW